MASPSLLYWLAGLRGASQELQAYETLRRERTTEIQFGSRANGDRYDCAHDDSDKRDAEIAASVKFRVWLYCMTTAPRREPTRLWLPCDAAGAGVEHFANECRRNSTAIPSTFRASPTICRRRLNSEASHDIGHRDSENDDSYSEQFGRHALSDVGAGWCSYQGASRQ